MSVRLTTTHYIYDATLAQMDRALGYELRGQEFESLRSRQIIYRVVAEWPNATDCKSVKP